MNFGLRVSGLVLALVISAACERTGPERSNDTAVLATPPPVTPSDSTLVLASPWDSAAGAAFLVAGPATGEAAVVLPLIDADADLDTAHFDIGVARGRIYDLFAGGRRVGSGRAGRAVTTDVPDDCSAWPHIALTTDSQAVGWTVALEQGRFTAVTPDSIAAMPRADSTRLVMELARIASAAPGDTVEALRGIPYVVRRGYRFTVPGAPPMIFAEISRSLPQEAYPAQEVMLLVVEQDSLTLRYRLAYMERASGTEETLESTELLLVGQVTGRNQPVILLARDSGDGVTYSLLEREGPRQWHVRWNSPYAGC
jgi:hypothetical protein